jgi:small-conductance mechanosensitive channel
MSGQSIIDNLLQALSKLFANALNELFGPALNQPVAGEITRTDLVLTGIFSTLVILVNASIILSLRRKIKSAAGRDSEKWLHRTLSALFRPFCVLLWIYGAYLAITPLIVKLPQSDELVAGRNGFDHLFNLGMFAILIWLTLRLTHVLEVRLAEWARGTKSKFDDLLVPLIGRSLRILLPVLGIIFALPLLDLSPEYAGILAKGTSILLILAVAAIAVQAVHIGEKAVLTRYDISATDNLQARKIYTQVHVLGKAAYVIIALFAVASILMLFEEVRRFGASLLASAGVVGIIIGFAAQKTISNLFAGFQLAMTQPIRLDDVVIVEGEWGRVEEITLTYVVIRIWDERRLIVPLSYFIEKPFQNWTRISADLLGSVFLWVDYSLPLEETRAALKTVIENHPLWDKRFWNLQVTDSNERAMQIRVLATSSDSSKSWDLRCAIREALITYIQKQHPQSLPLLRGTIESATLKPRLAP